MKTVRFEETSYSDFVDWAKLDKKVFKKITDLIKDIDRNGASSGIGKPEQLKYKLSGYWSRRITDEHRLIYKRSKMKLSL